MVRGGEEACMGAGELCVADGEGGGGGGGGGLEQAYAIHATYSRLNIKFLYRTVAYRLLTVPYF